MRYYISIGSYGMLDVTSLVKFKNSMPYLEIRKDIFLYNIYCEED